MHDQIKIGFIGQGWIGKNYADDFEQRGFSVVRYALEEPYVQNKEKIAECGIVFIAVPTPTTPKGFDDSIVRSAVSLVGKGNIAVIKSTIIPGTTRSIQDEYPDIFVLHSPEFLAEATAQYDAAHSNRNIIGIPNDTFEYRERAQAVMSVLPDAPYSLICPASDAEFVKYGGNCFLYTKVVYMNLLFDLAEKYGANWENIKNAMMADPRIGSTHMDPVHDGGRGAGGNCFIKDFATFSVVYKERVGNVLGVSVLKSIEEKNSELLKESGKNNALLKDVYGEEYFTS